MTEPDYGEVFCKCNHTELMQVARRAGHNVLPTFTREQLIQIIVLEAEGTQEPNEVDDIRLAIMQFLIDHRLKLETQITCPAKSFEPTACFGCVDAQVVHCYTSNGANSQQLITLHRKTPVRA